MDWNDPNLRFVDLNGDGHADVLVTEHDVFSWDPSLAEPGRTAALVVKAWTRRKAPPDGREVTEDKSEIMGLDADVVLHAASKATRDNTNTDDIVELLASGKSVITTTSYSHLPTYGRETEKRITNACKRSGPVFTPPVNIPGSCSNVWQPRSPGCLQARGPDHRFRVRDCSAVSEKGMLGRSDGHGQGPRREIHRRRTHVRAARYSTNSPWPRPPISCT